MARLQFGELQLLRQIPAVIATAALTTYAKRDSTVAHIKSLKAERWHACVGSSHFKPLLDCRELHDTHAKVRSGGAIDLAIHLHRLSTIDAVQLRRTRGI